MVRILALLMCLILPTSGCAIRGSGSGVAYTVDATMIAVGAGTYLKAEAEDCDPGDFGLGCLDNDISKASGLTLLAVGIIGMIINHTINQGVNEEQQAVMTVSGPPGLVIAAPPATPEFCGPAVRAWEREDDPTLRHKRYQAMPPACRTMLATRVPGADAR